MKIIYGLQKIRKIKKPVVALGVFDGVHRGHIKILRAIVTKAHSIRGRSVVLTFWPHPQAEKSLYSLEHRLRLIGEQGVDICIVINFNRQFCGMPAFDFIKDILIEKIGANFIYIGENFRFGRNAEGNYRTLRKLSGKFNFKLKVFKVIKMGGREISSTYIRNLITKGDLPLACKLLSRRVSILGTVIKGNFLGRKIGFPTANINPHHEVVPPNGVYAVRVIFNGKIFKGVCYIGKRPTFQIEKAKIHIEVHIFDFKQNIYAKFLEIQFIKKIRKEKKFDSPASLAKEIRKDASIANRVFSLH
ncbi:MAG: bifunctional riboflavin kinase/FAD synthetase [Candidatus Omnitrophica bacterium]|nr:bifunctional riboflavin kinase/FAD synthetase [Candidatus Omnitrophota bacterium]